MPALLKDCKQVETDFEKIMKMAEVFAHPLSLIYHVGKNLLINGVDIIKKTTEAVLSYKEDDYYDFGKYIAETMDEVFLSNP